ASGRRVSLLDPATGAADTAVARMRTRLERQAAKGGVDPDDTLERVGVVDELVGADLLIEAVVEGLAVKQLVFRDADVTLPASAILASNTSSIPIAALAEATARPDRVIGMHFFNPVPVLELVEVIRGPETSDATNATIVALARDLGKVPAE